MISASNLPVRWHKSSYSTNGGDCVEIGEGMPEIVAVRDSKTPEGPALTFAADAWAVFISAVRSDEFPV
jgi:hypothetical protein